MPTTNALSTNKDLRWLLLALVALGAITVGQLFEQIVFVPNWLIGDVDANMEHFRQFKQTTDPGLFYFPLALLALVAHILLLRTSSPLSKLQQQSVKRSLVILLFVLGLTGYIISQINVPVIDRGLLSGDAQQSKMVLWAMLNVFRVVLPAYGWYQLSTLLSLKSAPTS